MGYWNLYFVAKLALYYERTIGFHWLPNLFFAAFLLLPLQPPRHQLVRLVLAFPLAVWLLYYDSWLPSIDRILSQMPALSAFSPAYLVELIGRFVNPWMVSAFCIALLIYQMVRQKLRVTTFVLLGMMAVPAGFGPASTTRSIEPSMADAGGAGGNSAPLASSQLDQALAAFYQQQAKVKVAIGAAGEGKAPFDIIFLHICSLAWDDLAVAGQQDAALFKRFDIVFKDFNSAASYSGPAGIRLLRATCGQQPHDNLYRPAPNGCYLFEQLQQSGFQTSLLMNHDGKFGNFLADLQDRGGLKLTPMGDLGAAQHMKAFDGSPIYSDFDMLTHWLEDRSKSSAKRAALFYSTVSLHDGNIVDWSQSRSSLDTYGPRLKQLLEDIDRFISELERQGRRAVVVFVPEHGANMRGDTMQIPGMREIPSPQITRIPVGIKLVGLNVAPGTPPLSVGQPSSYTALSELLARFVAHNPYDEALADLPSYVADLPQSDFVAENDKTVVVRHGSRYFIRMPDGSWSDFQ